MRLSFFSLVLVLSASLPTIAQQPASPDRPMRVDSKVVHPPIAVSVPPAKIPDQARRRHEDGVCVVSLTVSSKGFPENVQLLRCTDQVFANNALASVKQSRFEPARTIIGNRPVPVIIVVTVRFRLMNGGTTNILPPPLVRLAFFGLTNATPVPGAEGVYPLSKEFDPPKLVRFFDEGFLHVAEGFPDGSGCRLELSLDARGNATQAKTISCDDPSMAVPAAESLRHSMFHPATLNGSPEPVKATVHLTYDGFSPIGQAAQH